MLTIQIESAKSGRGEFLPDSPFLSGPIGHFVNFFTSQAAPLVIRGIDGLLRTSSKYATLWPVMKK